MNEARSPGIKVAQKVGIVIPYFGSAPPWLPFFLRSCQANPGFDWILFTDFDIGPAPNNVHHYQVTFDEFVSKLEAGLDLKLDIIRKDSYKLTDLKPMLGHVFSELLEPYDYWGWGDMDVVYGNLDEHFGQQLGQYDVISCHTYLLSGHLAFLRNTKTLRSLFSCFPKWRSLVVLPTHQAFDENIMSALFFADQPDRRAFLYAPLYLPTVVVNDEELTAHFSERYSTFNRPWLLPDGKMGTIDEWYWKDGKLTGDATGDASLAYAHFSHWHSGRYSKDKKRRLPWSKGGMHHDSSLAIPLNSFRINADGFFAVAE